MLHAIRLLQQQQQQQHTTGHSDTQQEVTQLLQQTPADSHTQQEVTRLLLVLIAVVSAAVESSKANFQLRLLLIQLYNMIGELSCIFDEPWFYHIWVSVKKDLTDLWLKHKIAVLSNMTLTPGCPSASRQCYTRLEIKSIQLDTLFFVSALQALDCCHYGFANAVLGQTNNFFAYADKEVSAGPDQQLLCLC